MIRKSIGFLLVAAVGLFLIGCGGETQTAEKSSGDEVAGKVAKETAEKPPKPDVAYTSKEDPNAVYSMDDIEMVGSYLRVDFRGLSPEQENRVIHRLRTELSTCNSGLTIDECMVNRPHCAVAVHLAKQVIREEKTKG
jgi:hypothetical protein